MIFPRAVGAIIKRNGKYLLLDRKNIEYGFASVAGHVDDETPEEALRREVIEESQLKLLSFKKLFEEDVPWNTCYKHKGHHWIVFECKTEGTQIPEEDEAKSMGWYSPAEMKTLKLERVWEYFFKKLMILPNND